jgi:peptidyl-prolyl cis-trans isomerase SurA
MATLCLASALATAQPAKVIDEIIGVVGNKTILLSDLDAQYQQYLGQGNYAGNELKCQVLDQLLLTKLLIHYAMLDSVPVSDGQVEGEIEKRIAYFTEQFGGSTEKLEAYYQKTIPEIKNEFKPLIREQLLSQAMQQKIVGKAAASPADVKSYFHSIPKDSLPYINSEIEYAEISFKINISPAEKNKSKDKITQLRERILKGEDFSTLAVLYSQDAGSAKNGGELGFVPRGTLVPEFEAAAFRLKKGDISDVVETKFGFHIIQMIERRGEQINVRHILLKPDLTNEDLLRTKGHADSIAYKIRNRELTFEDGAVKYSDAEDTRYNGGNVVNPQTGNTRFETNQVDAMVFFQLDKMKEGDISNPSLVTNKDGTQSYKIFFLKKRTKPHVANLTDDYQRIQTAAAQAKQAKLLDDWILRKKKSTYIRINPEYVTCSDLKKWEN